MKSLILATFFTVLSIQSLSAAEPLPDLYPDNKSARLQGYYPVKLDARSFVLMDYNSKIKESSKPWVLAYSIIFQPKTIQVEGKPVDYARRVDVFDCSSSSRYANKGILFFEQNKPQPSFTKTTSSTQPFEQLEWHPIPQGTDLEKIQRAICGKPPSPKAKLLDPINADKMNDYYRNFLSLQKYRNGSHWMTD